MIKKTNLPDLIEALIETPNNAVLVTQINSAADNFRELLLNGTHQTSKRRKKDFLCHQTNHLVRLMDRLYVEFRFYRHTGLARALILLRDVAEELVINVPLGSESVLLPKVFRDRERDRIYLERRVIQKWLSCKHVDPQLIELILFPLDNFCVDQTVNYQDYCYLRQHIQHLEQIDLAYIKDKEATEEVCSALIRANFNNLQFINYCVDQIKEGYSTHSFDKSEKHRYLSIQKRKFKNMYTAVRFSYDSRYISAQKNILNWLREESRKWA